MANEPDTNPKGDTNEGNDPKPDSELAKAQERIKNLEQSKADLIKSEKELKGKLKAKEDAEAIAKGDLQSIIESQKAELEALRVKEAELEEAKKQRDEIITATKKELLEMLPDEHKKLAEDLTIAKLREYVKLNSKKDPAGMDAGRSGNGTIDVTGREYDDFSLKELDELQKNNIAAYKKRYRSKFKKEPVLN